MNTNEWDKRLLNMAGLISTWSKEEQKQGAVIADLQYRIVSTGFNGKVQGIPEDVSDWPAENVASANIMTAAMNALLFAKQDIRNCTLFTYPMPPTAQDMAIYAQAGILYVVTIQPGAEHVAGYHDDLDTSLWICKQAGISTRPYTLEDIKQ